MQVAETPFLDRQQLAARWGCAPSTLARWAWEGKGPRSIRFGKKAMYRLVDIEAYESERSRKGRSA